MSEISRLRAMSSKLEDVAFSTWSSSAELLAPNQDDMVEDLGTLGSVVVRAQPAKRYVCGQSWYRWIITGSLAKMMRPEQALKDVWETEVAGQRAALSCIP